MKDRKKILITSFDMEIGGVERSLINLLDSFDYKKYSLDLLLYNHSGEFMPLIPKNTNLLSENKVYSTIRKGIGALVKSGYYNLALSRLMAKYQSKLGERKGLDDTYQMQLMWKYCNKNFSKVSENYDVAISYLWPHNFVAEKVNAKKKIAWIHTDYSKISPHREMDLKIWQKYNHIIGVSQECVNSFLKVYPSLKDKCLVMENITSPEFIHTMSESFEVTKYQKNDFNLLSVARFSYAKGIDQGIEALKILRERGYKDIKWYVVGYGGDEEQLKELVKKYSLENDFIFLGKQSNPYPYMKECDLYVQPSRYEGKAVTVIEAQILNKPVLITDYPTAKSQIVNGEDGEITELSVKGIADGIEKFYKNRELLKKYEINCKNKSFENIKELEKLYELF
ncbi:glycosyltransferase [Cetobacterium somerae]|uniref:glycosyltransferase n=1 Tax=Cetobacterium somerae TaxID=188913 RepID=UPI00211DAA3E|nr:glycosyltransferase [Cetobacterium somerae]